MKHAEGDSPAPAPVRRSRRSHEAVLDAAIAVFDEVGYERLTVDAIARQAGVSKATIYRWWNGRAAIVMEAFLRRVEPEVAFPDSGSLRDDLVEQLTALATVLDGTPLGRMAIGLLGLAQGDPELADALRAGWLEPRRVAGRAVLARAVEAGALRADVDAEVVLDGLYGPLYLRLLFGHASLDRPSMECLVDQVLDGVAQR